MGLCTSNCVYFLDQSHETSVRMCDPLLSVTCAKAPDLRVTREAAVLPAWLSPVTRRDIILRCLDVKAVISRPLQKEMGVGGWLRGTLGHSEICRYLSGMGAGSSPTTSVLAPDLTRA
ncbi:hypothetical protein PoB_002210200 [Plakobranchus ocellatus]|uniref:Uncharacterized protein n=1 Tax=Plakobranchus ocellatus TaxID=259542 RepID=A0AAV3ZJX4_9GAST|nr:hypothetical protein PoB_002210200 [Plakobranchus ocellatus]